MTKQKLVFSKLMQTLLLSSPLMIKENLLNMSQAHQDTGTTWVLKHPIFVLQVQSKVDQSMRTRYYFFRHWK